jgi:hypothetical protein
MVEKSKHWFGILGEKVAIKLTFAIALSEDGIFLPIQSLVWTLGF